MGTPQRSAVLLSFFGDDLDPLEITTCLGVEPSVGVRKGGVWHTTRGTEKVAQTGSWRLLANDCEPADLNDQIKRLLSSTFCDIDCCRRLSAKYGGRVFCGLFLASSNDGLRLSPETMSLLAERHLALDLDIYGYEDDDT